MARGKGEGSVYKRKSDGMWCASIELPPTLFQKRPREVVYAKTKGKVLEKKREAEKEIAKNGGLALKSPTVEKWMHYWLTKIAEPNLAPNTVVGYRNNAVNFIVPLLGKKKLRALTTHDVRRLHEEVLAAPVDKRLRGKKNLPPGTKLMSTTSARLAHNTLSAALKAAMTEKQVDLNVCDLVEKPKRAVVEKKYLNFEQAVHLLEYVADKPNGAMWATYLLIGPRRGEGAAIEAERVTDHVDLSWQIQRITNIKTAPADYEYRHIRSTFYFVRPKSSSGWRRPPLVEPLKSILERHIGDQKEGLIFLDHKGEAWDPSDIGKAWKKLLAEAGLPTDVELHGSRRTTATLLYEAGVPEHLIQEILGHASVEVTRAYNAGGNQKALKSALKQLSTHLGLGA